MLVQQEKAEIHPQSNFSCKESSRGLEHLKKEWTAHFEVGWSQISLSQANQATNPVILVTPAFALK